MIQQASMKMSSEDQTMMNPAYRVTPDNRYDEDTTEDAAKDAAKDSAEDPAKEAAKDVAEEDKDAAEDQSVPSLESDLSSDDDQINIPGIEGRSSSLRDHVDHKEQDCPQPYDDLAFTAPNFPSIWDPPGRHGAQLHDFLHSTREKILDCLFVQVLRMNRYLEEQWRLNLIPENEVLLEGLSLLVMMGSKLDRIAETSRDPAHDPKQDHYYSVVKVPSDHDHDLNKYRS